MISNKLHNNWWTVCKQVGQYGLDSIVQLIFYPVHLRIVALNIWATGWNGFLSFVHNTKGHGKGSGRKIEELLDIEDDAQEITMVYD